MILLVKDKHIHRGASLLKIVEGGGLVLTIVRILDGKSEHIAHAWSKKIFPETTTIYTPTICICKGWKVKCRGILLYREESRLFGESKFVVLFIKSKYE